MSVVLLIAVAWILVGLVCGVLAGMKDAALAGHDQAVERARRKNFE
jgi:hypothetical protein